MTEGDQFDVLIATERISAGSEGGGAKTTRTVTVSRTVRREVGIDLSKAKVRAGEYGLMVIGAGDIKRQIREELTHKFSVSTQGEFTVEDSVGIEVKPRSAVELIIDWKLRYQRGTASALTADGITIEIPYELPLRLTFDHHTKDLPATG
ncbi:hypothetical protein [Streptomyces sp. NRRL B-24484]|uniref:hypothetical protein n=1 Tax=Streptomyces sp. NRRL B-24484 TaxID=1463833 RepID=UPI0013314AE8|nr:hypothetical protein [Streptomyces sp. NRRL B-24484]